MRRYVAAPMRRIVPTLVAISGFSAACSVADPPPGELIGGFRFVATLDQGSSEDRCLFGGSPSQLDFEGILSFDPESRKLWVSTEKVRWEGTLDGARFSTRTPVEGPGIPRRLAACTCTLAFSEVLEGDLLGARDCGQSLEAPEEPGASADRTCPATLPDGSLSWSACGCVVGALREEVEFPADEPECVCIVDGVKQPAPSRCEISYQLKGTLP
ncbi:hypothetical protein [Vulgatibacter incomptus]|uniref:Lipoprotein n=1 Tax=Vulgatibacter incomptus TaxID=1391653 RepID=A0A0K1PGC7_9BACT|nr:hypothetical protein [Vulgatibacter incomptus]AKU92159.1 hypothetical protein AKJ08_2546 [Vulgatibacter incomptus]